MSSFKTRFSEPSAGSGAAFPFLFFDFAGVPLALADAFADDGSSAWRAFFEPLAESAGAVSSSSGSVFQRRGKGLAGWRWRPDGAGSSSSDIGSHSRKAVRAARKVSKASLAPSLCAHP